MAFEKQKFLIKVQGGRSYLPVAARLIWFREEHPDWGITTTPIEINLEKQYAIYQASIFNAEGKLMATATKTENIRGFPDYLEKAETGAVGRALAFCGYGTQFEPSMHEEGERNAVDGQQEARTPEAPAAARPAQRARVADRATLAAKEEFAQAAEGAGYTLRNGEGEISNRALRDVLVNLPCAHNLSDAQAIEQGRVEPTAADWRLGTDWVRREAAAKKQGQQGGSDLGLGEAATAPVPRPRSTFGPAAGGPGGGI